jgi:FtsP/CotA-like multicopper oxidase with cupredoxin domain
MSKLELFAKATLPHSSGCVRDLDPADFENRRVLFTQGEAAHGFPFGIETTIMHPPLTPPPPPQKFWQESQFVSDEAVRVAASFEEYKLPDGAIDWEAAKGPKHVCIHVEHKGSHKQLWVLKNDTGLLHNFHIHQMKFRLATLDDFDEHHIDKPHESHTCTAENQCSCDDKGCTAPDYKLYDDNPNPDRKFVWHDTIPVPNGKPVFIIMSFDDSKQLGRFVYHCHILKHEDLGLMAPIEVWRTP